MKLHKTHEVAGMAGIHRDTLLRWLREKRIPEPGRDRNEWRVFTENEAQYVINYAQQLMASPPMVVRESTEPYGPYAEQVKSLIGLDWDFVTADTEYLNHSLHPYPCKFIPQIPNTLIQELSSVGETVLDPFCGSGTTLVEALRLNRNAVGVDANPIAALITRVKTTIITVDEGSKLSELAAEMKEQGLCIGSGQMSLFGDAADNGIPEFDTHVREWIHEWFDDHVIMELSAIKKRCVELENLRLRNIALAALSAILVAVSRQDSDTRYVRRKKNLQAGDTFIRYAKTLESVTQQILEFSRETNPKVSAQIYNSDILSEPKIPNVDIVVCSPPYPNAYSYHLYHRSRMLWLGFDTDEFKRREIGSHRKYSSKGKNAATEETFRSELEKVLSWIAKHLKYNRHACFVMGDSVINGKTVKNDELLIEVASHQGFRLEANINRELLKTKKYFNPSIGKIKDEHIVILRNTGKV